MRAGEMLAKRAAAASRRARASGTIGAHHHHRHHHQRRAGTSTRATDATREGERGIGVWDAIRARAR